MDRNRLFREIPKVDILLEREEIRELEQEYGHAEVMNAVRHRLEHLREMIRQEDEERAEQEMHKLVPEICRQVREQAMPSFRKVVNATGTILHTNLGRAPLSRAHAQKLAELMSGYSNLEYDLETGERGERYSHLSSLLCRLTGAEDALVVNNNAAAALLILDTIAKEKEVIVSRGELVEIGGSFRIPEILKTCGAFLSEVGTTNKTRLSDYERAVTEKTAAILKVHTSNYRIVGFTESVPVRELRRLGDRYDLPVIEDLGSGVLTDLTRFGAEPEPLVQEEIRSGADLVCFSGDKLLGGAQAGIILGKKCYIDRLKKNPLTRALRVDKFTVGALELVLREYLKKDEVFGRIPVLQMISETEESCQKRAQSFLHLLEGVSDDLELDVRHCKSQVGGGALPTTFLPGYAVTAASRTMSADALQERMRKSEVPVIGRIVEDRIYMDIRTIREEEYPLVKECLQQAVGQKSDKGQAAGQKRR